MGTVKQLVFSSNIGQFKCGALRLTSYNDETKSYNSIRPKPPFTQLMRCFQAYAYNESFAIYDNHSLISGTTFGDLFVLLFNKIQNKEVTSVNLGKTEILSNIDDNWYKSYGIPIQINGQHLTINNNPCYLLYTAHGNHIYYISVGIYNKNTKEMYVTCSAEFPESLMGTRIITGGLLTLSPPANNKPNTPNFASFNLILQQDYVLATYVVYERNNLIAIGDSYQLYSITYFPTPSSGVLSNEDKIKRDNIIGTPEIREFDPDNPYSSGGTSETGGGNGSFDKDSDPVDFTPLPTLSAIGSGVAGLFSPTLSEIRSLANYLWNNELDWSQLVKLVANPIDMLISLTVVPIKPKTSTTADIKVGFISTGVSMHKCDEQYVKFNCGKLTVDRYYDSALDFAPFTKIYIYLPFIGQRELNADDVVGNDLEVEYNIDLFTGTCVAEIKVADSVLYSFEGNVASQIPIIAESFDQLASAIIGAVATVGTVAVAAGAGAASAGATAAEGGADAAGIAAARSAGASAELTKAAPRLASAGANTVISSKPSISHAGSASANIGLLAQKTPYLIYQIPRQSIADSYQTFNGLPSNMTVTLGELSGFTQVERIHLENISATSRELDIIEAKLKEGVLL